MSDLRMRRQRHTGGCMSEPFLSSPNNLRIFFTRLANDVHRSLRFPPPFGAMARAVKAERRQ